MNTLIALSLTKKGNMSVTECISKMKLLSDEMTAAGKPIGNDILVSYISTGLDLEYTLLVSAIMARVEPCAAPLPIHYRKLALCREPRQKSHLRQNTFLLTLRAKLAEKDRLTAKMLFAVRRPQAHGTPFTVSQILDSAKEKHFLVIACKTFSTFHIQHVGLYVKI